MRVRSTVASLLYQLHLLESRSEKLLSRSTQGSSISNGASPVRVWKTMYPAKPAAAQHTTPGDHAREMPVTQRWSGTAESRPAALYV